MKLVLSMFLFAGTLAGAGGWVAHQTPENSGSAAKPEPSFQGSKTLGVIKEQRAIVDQHGDRLPEGAVARLGTLRFRVGNGVNRMALSPDGKMAVSVGGNSLTQFWEIPTGREPRRIEWKQGGGGRVVAYSPDNRLLATIPDHQGMILLWDPATGKELTMAPLKMQFTTCLAFSPNSTLLAIGGGATSYEGYGESKSILSLWTWDGSNLQPLWEVYPDKDVPIKREGSAGILSLAFSADGNHIATGGLNNNFLRIWNVADGKKFRLIKTTGQQIGALAYDTTGRVLASGSDDGVVALHDLKAESKPREFKQPGEVRALAFSSDGTTLAVGGGPENGWRKAMKNEPFIVLLNATTFRETRRVSDVRETVVSLAFSQDSRILAAGMGGVIRVWETTSGKELSVNAGHHNWVSSVDISEDGQLGLTSGADGSIILWALASGLPKRHIRAHHAEAREAVFVPGGPFVASVGSDQDTRVWELVTGRQTRQWQGSPGGSTYTLAISADGSTLASGNYQDGTVLLWDVPANKPLLAIKTAHSPGEGVRRLAFSPAGKILAIGETLLNARKFRRGNEDVAARVQIWNAVTGKKLLEFPVDRICVNSLSFSPDGKVLATTGGHWADKHIGLWEVASGRMLAQLPCELSDGIVRFSPDGRTLAWGSYLGDICLWEMASRKPRRLFYGRASAITSLAFAPDSKTMISGNMDCTALVWDVTGFKGKTATPVPFSRTQLLALWEELASSDAEVSGRAIWSLVNEPKPTVALIAEQWHKLPDADTSLISKLLIELDSDRFKIRQSAEEELERLGKLAEPALRDALRQTSSLEVRRRIEGLLRKRDVPRQFPEILQTVRAIETLEHIGGKAARQALEDFARRTFDLDLKQEALAAVDRLGKRLPHSNDR